MSFSIVVADAHSSDESEKSIASSLVVMPHTLPSVGTASVVERQTEGQGAATMNGMGTPTLASLSLPSSSSAVGSDSDSEVSLVSIPSSDEGEIWEEVGSSVGGPPRERNVENQGQPIDYVLLYDDRSSEDE
jgi:next-to-BRCA1 protein 1